MRQFNLLEWLQNKSRKVVTRDGRPVRIVCTDSPILHHPIVGFVECDLFTWTDDGKVIYGGKCEDKNDLFFADEEDELTEFENELEMMMVSFSNENLGSDVRKEMPKQKLHSYAHRLLDIARKELENGAVEFAKSYMEDANPSFEKVQESEELWKWKMSCLRGVNKAYAQGKQDALKDLPKWKKATEYKDLEKHVAILEEDKVLLSNYLEEGDYYIELDNLKTLPKEE